MVIESWLPIGFLLPNGEEVNQAIYGGPNWQIIDTSSNERALLAKSCLYQQWIDSGLLDVALVTSFSFGNGDYGYVLSEKNKILCPIKDSDTPVTLAEALSFSDALKTTRGIDSTSPLQDSIYIEKLARFLPTYSISSELSDDIVLGEWLTGGVHVSVTSFRRLRQMMSWLTPADLKEVVETAGFEVGELTIKSGGEQEIDSSVPNTANKEGDGKRTSIKTSTFSLPGRPELEMFFNEHIIDILQNRERYKALGIGFPSAIALHGPPGCGKTFAVEQLVEFLGWPSFEIDASSVASPYIHDTSKKVAEVFDKAIENSPSVIVIDEMESFLADREMGSSHHRVEEVAEFLRRIPEAVKNDVLIIAMTNRIEIIDPAILRRGRFDHIISVDFASEEEILSLLHNLLSSLPITDSVDAAPLAKQLGGRPLSDVTFVIREGARLAARAGNDKLTQEYLLAALNDAPAREREGSTSRPIGFL